MSDGAVMPFNPFSALTSKIFGGLSLALLLACGGLYLWGSAESHRADAWMARSKLEASNHRETKANYRAAQVAAKATARAHREADEKRFAYLAREADNAKDTLDRLRAAADSWRDAHGMRACGGTVAGPSGGPGAGGEDRPAEGGDGPGAAELVVLTRKEFDQLAEHDNTVTDRLNRVKAWGDRLIEDGRAIPLAEFGKEP